MTRTTPDPNLFLAEPVDAPDDAVTGPSDRGENGAGNGSENGSVSTPQKRGSLVGGALTGEVHDSSRRVFSNARGNKNVTS